MAAVPLPKQLADIAALLGRMCSLSAGALQSATVALLDGRERLAHQVAERDAEIDALRVQVEEIGTDALLFHAPVAGDLRTVVAGIRAAGDVARMADLALHVARVGQRRRGVPDEVRYDFERMSELAVAMAVKAAEVVSTRNVVLAVELVGDDDAMDTQHRHMFEVLMADDWPHGVPAAVDVTLLARFYERFADHAVVVAHETVYAVTGQAPDAIPI